MIALSLQRVEEVNAKSEGMTIVGFLSLVGSHAKVCPTWYEVSRKLTIFFHSESPVLM